MVRSLGGGIGDLSRSSLKRKGENTFMRWSITSILLAITIIASTIATLRTFYVTNQSTTGLCMGLFVLLVGISIHAAVGKYKRFRDGFSAAAIFGILYLISMFLFAIVNRNVKYVDSLLETNFKIGLALLGLAFLIGAFFHSLSMLQCERIGTITGDEQNDASKPDLHGFPDGK